MSKNIVLIGGSTGIGFELAKKLKDDHNVTVISRTNPELDGITHHTADVLEDELPEIEVSTDGLVYLPGSINLKPFKILREENFRDDFEINFLGQILHVDGGISSIKQI